MASLQKKADSWYCQFMHRRQRHTFTIGKVDEIEARAVGAKVDYILMRLKQHLLDVPAGMDIVTFIQFDGKPPDDRREEEPRETPFAEFRDAYLKTFSNGAIEDNSLCTAKIHLAHLAGTLGAKFPMNALTLADLQRHVDRRQKKVAGVTIKKELDTLRAVWKWAARMGYVEGDFPGRGLVYPKGDEKPPFMTWAEIERRIAAGGDPEELWECLYLTAAEITELLAFVKGRRAPAWVYPAFVLVAHTGARRSEMMRVKLEDVNLAEGTVTIREKKRVRDRRTTRRVPMTTLLAAVLKDWLSAQGDKAHLFGLGAKTLSVQAVQKAFVRVLKKSKWEVLKGWHVLRHSFISALASRCVDQRIIDDFTGHTTETMRRRYRHLYPSTQQEAIKLVFG